MFALFVAFVGAAQVPTSSHMSGNMNLDWETLPFIEYVPAPILKDLRAARQNVVKNGCPVNLCFALQGDTFITDRQFQRQKEFIELIVAITTTDDRGNFCAAQYGRSTTAISPLTKKRFEFLDALDATSKLGNGIRGSQTNIAAALAYTGFQVRTRVADPKKVILFGDGVETIGGQPRRVARKIESEGTEICAVAVGSSKSISDLEDIVGDPTRVFRINDYFDLAEIVVATVNQVCNN